MSGSFELPIHSKTAGHSISRNLATMEGMKARYVFLMRGLLLGTLLLATLRSHAQLPLDGMLLGMNESDLLGTFDSVQRLRKPTVGPHGLRGLWILPNTPVSGLPFETTFYMKDKHVHRIEQYWTTTEHLCGKQPSFSTLVSDMEAKYGAGLTSNDFVSNGGKQQSTVWEAGAYDVLAHISKSPSQCAIRVIYTAHVTKDASEL